MNQIVKVVVVIVLGSITASFSSPVRAHQTRVMPVELENLALSIECDPLYDHYENAVNRLPPFAYYDYNPVLADRYGDVATFLCIKTKKEGYGLNLVLAKFPLHYPSFTDVEDIVSYGPREGGIISVLEIQKIPLRNDLGEIGLELIPQRSPRSLEGFMRWPGYEWLKDVEGSTEYTPITIVNEYGTYPVYYYSPEHGWLYFVTD